MNRFAIFSLSFLKTLAATLVFLSFDSSITGITPEVFQTEALASNVNNNENIEEEIRKLESLSKEQYKLGKYKEAIQTLEKIIPLQKKSRYYQPYKEADALNNIGFIYFIQGDRVNSSVYIKQVLDFGQELKGRRREVLENSTLSQQELFEYYILSHRTRGGGVNPFFDDYNAELDKTIEYMQYMLEISRKLGYRAEEGFVLSGLGNAYTGYPIKLDDLPKSINYYKQSLAVANSLVKDDEAARIMFNCTSMNEGEADLQAYEVYLRVQLACGQAALSRYRSLKNPEKEYVVLAQLSSVSSYLKNYEQSSEYLKQLLSIRKAAQQVAKQREIYPNQEGILEELASLSVVLGRFDEATHYYQMLQETKESANGYQGLGNIYYLRGEYAKAIEYYQSALKKRTSKRPWRGNIEVDLSFALLEHGKSGEAEALISSEIPYLEKSVAPGFIEDGVGEARFIRYPELAEQTRPYSLLQRVLIQQNRASDALEASERGRSRATKALLTNRLSGKPAQRLDEIKIDEKAFTFNTHQIQQLAKEQQATLVTYSIIYDDKSIIKRHPQVSELYIWVIKPTGEIAFRRSDFKPIQQQKTDLQELVATTRQAVITRGNSNPNKNQTFSPGNLVQLKDDLPNWQPWKVIASNPAKQTLTLTHPTFEPGVTIDRSIADVVSIKDSSRIKDPQLQQLYQLLIAPIADLLPTDPNAHVVFIPHGELSLVPFPALQQSDGTYLIENHTILTAPSIQVLDLTQQQRKRQEQKGGHNSLVVGIPRNAVVVGNPTMPKVAPEIGEAPLALRPLPGAEQEAKSIAQLLNTQALTGDRATKAAVLQQLSRASIIHLATHGIFDDRNGLNSAVAFAPSGKDNGLLTAYEILNLKLKAELVVLSACDSGRGRITGDGVIGLSRSLIASGVPSVVVSLWAIPDAPTAELMADFYRNLQKGQNKAQALRHAMLTTMKTHPAPRDWAAFTLIGEAE